jgi:hypothetical protein
VGRSSCLADDYLRTAGMKGNGKTGGVLDCGWGTKG